MNPYYSYPEINRWESSVWESHKAPADALMDYLVPTVYEQEYEKTTLENIFSGRTDGIYDAKSKMYTFPDVVQKWDDKGLHYHCTSMGFVSWIAMVPHTVINGSVQSPQVLIVPYTCDFSRPEWAMHTLEYMSAYNETAIDKDVVLLYLVFGSSRSSGIYMDILMELSAIFHLDLTRVFLDLSALHKKGDTLEQIPNLDRSAFGSEETISDIPVIDITNKWQCGIAHQYIVGSLNKHTKDFDLEWHKHSTVGKYMAQSMEMEYKYSDSNDPALISKWAMMGLSYENHEISGERYVTMTPKCVTDDMTCKIPLLIAMKEVREINPYQTLTAFQFYNDFIEIAAQGECMIVFFALETPDDNELLNDIVREIKSQYPVDEERIYITGQSHNGMFALEYARRHPDLITAVAQLNDRHGICAPEYSVDNVKMTDEMLAAFSKVDMPIINICGHAENVFAHAEPDSEVFLHNAQGYRRRLKAFRCPDRSIEEICDAPHSLDLATRMNGVPADRTEVRYSMGTESYISDLMNIDGKWHLRLVSIQNLPHMITPQMAELSWSFLRRFARNPQTGEIIERY